MVKYSPEQTPHCYSDPPPLLFHGLPAAARRHPPGKIQPDSPCTELSHRLQTRSPPPPSPPARNRLHRVRRRCFQPKHLPPPDDLLHPERLLQPELAIQPPTLSPPVSFSFCTVFVLVLFSCSSMQVR
jgi:hypothetical protein